MKEVKGKSETVRTRQWVRSVIIGTRISYIRQRFLTTLNHCSTNDSKLIIKKYL